MIKKFFYYRYRDAITGKYVSKAYAIKHPKTTVREKCYR